MEGAACCPARTAGRHRRPAGTQQPRGHQQIFPSTHRKRCGWAGKAVLSLHTLSPEPSPHPCFPPVDVSAAGAPAGAGAPQRGGGFAKLISAQGFSLSQARIFLTLKGQAL